MARLARGASGSELLWSKRLMPPHRGRTPLSAQYHRLAFRRGKKRAAVVLAYTLLIIVYHLLAQEEMYQDLGGTSFDGLEREKKEQRLGRQLEKLGVRSPFLPQSLKQKRSQLSPLF